MSATLGHEIGRLMDIHAKFVHQNQSLMLQVSDNLAKFQTVLSAAKVYKLRSERRARIARDWLTSDEPETSSFLGDLTSEMIEASSKISDEKYRLAAAELGVDFDSLQQKANQKGDEALTNLLRFGNGSQRCWSTPIGTWRRRGLGRRELIWGLKRRLYALI